MDCTATGRLIFSVTPAAAWLIVMHIDAKRHGVGHERTRHAETAWKRRSKDWLT
jgi:hypothetical protein